MMDHYLHSVWNAGAGVLIDLNKQAQVLDVLLVRTGEDSINFDELRKKGLCLPLNRSGIPANENDVVRVSLGTAVKFVAELQPNISSDWEEMAQRSTDETMKEADEKGVDKCVKTWHAVRRAKAERIGEELMPFEP